MQNTRTIRLLTLGGSGNVTNNMYVYESDRDIIVVDCGIGFPDDAVPGIDLTIPDATYLKDKIHKIRGVVLSHAHEDHIGGLPFIIPQLGDHLPIYASRLTAGLIKEKFKEFHLSTTTINVVKDRAPIILGDFEVKMFPMTHSVPDSKHLLIKTPVGTIYHGTDFKFDWTPVGQQLPDVQSITKAGAEGITLLLSDCLRSEKEGYSLSESIIEDSFEREFRGVEGRVVITTMSSNISRIQQALNVARRSGRKVAFVGFSVERNVKVASELGFLHIPPRLVIHKRKIASLPRRNICLIVAGSQGQMGSSLTRMAENDHDFRLEPGDKVVFSADPIPGNEKNVYRVIDLLSKLKVEVSYSDISDDLHVSGHASSRELLMLMAMTKARYVMPIGGTYRHMVQYAKLAREMGYSDDKIILSEDARVITLSQDKVEVTDELIPLKTIYVEGSETAVPEERIDDRRLMFQEGVVVILVNVSASGLEFDLIPKGVLKQIDAKSIATIKSGLQSGVRLEKGRPDRLYLKDKIAKEANRLFVTKLKLNPLIIPVIIED